MANLYALIHERQFVAIRVTVNARFRQVSWHFELDWRALVERTWIIGAVDVWPQEVQY